MRRSEHFLVPHVTPGPSASHSNDAHVQAIAQPQLSLQAGSWQCMVKRLIDIVGALLFFLLFTPLYALLAVLVLLVMGAPVHYQQQRIGAGGRRFYLYKFRSMIPNAEATLRTHLNKNAAARHEWDKYQKLQDDPRISPLGKILRRMSLDELPQFWNVLKGDMSLVGPRPCMVHQEALYGRHWEHYCAVRPGITGLWQVSGRNRLTYADRVALDAQYVAGWSLGLDFRILAKTLLAVAAGDGSR
jgi:lipopolysaccharide/colanic/teichoic acid biosynthesis glycosyltransferase